MVHRGDSVASTGSSKEKYLKNDEYFLKISTNFGGSFAFSVVHNKLLVQSCANICSAGSCTHLLVNIDS